MHIQNWTKQDKHYVNLANRDAIQTADARKEEHCPTGSAQRHKAGNSGWAAARGNCMRVHEGVLQAKYESVEQGIPVTTTLL